MNIQCSCGHEMKDLKDNGRYAKCIKCKKVYDELGEEIEMQTSGIFDSPMFVKNGSILAPKVVDYRGNLFDDGTESY